MRQILFRGFNRKNNVWLYGFYLQNRKAHFVAPDEFATDKTWEDYEIDPETLGQYTGLKDRNGKEIYEGDIVAVEYYRNHHIVYQSGIWALADADDGWMNISDYDGNAEFSNKLDSLEVIGNIHDNPELLTED